MKEANSNDNYDAQTLILNDSNGNELFCYLEQLVCVEGQEYGLYIPLDPFFIVGKLKDKGALLVEDDEFDKIQPLIETELEKSSS